MNVNLMHNTYVQFLSWCVSHYIGEDGEATVVEKKRKPRQTRKKSELETQFPSYLQVYLQI